VDWLHNNASGYQYLLAHAHDGVIWGKVTEEGGISTAHHAVSTDYPPLRKETLQQARLFGEQGELYLWWNGTEWHSRQISDHAEAPTAEHSVMDEPHILWGTQEDGVQSHNGFSLLSDGGQGLKHVVPKEVHFAKRGAALALHVRHYLHELENGVNTIQMSRLMGLEMLNNG
jgi:CRISPR-associated protein (TIGR03984 family)